MSIKLTLTFESDWHVGEGAGASGHIDRIVRRHPEDGLPYVPGKTLTGILRDGCEKVARGLDEGRDDGPWQRFLRGLFGEESKGAANVATTTPARLCIAPARFDPALRRGLSAVPELKAALTFIKPGVKLDQNGVAESSMLRMEEVVLAGAELETGLELDLPEGEARLAALVLLTAGARAVDRLGAKRRRGNGRCRLAIEGAARHGLEILGREPPAWPQNGEAPNLILSFPDVAGETGGWHVVPLDLELRSPVLIPAGTAGNVIATRDHIPGSLLLPALDRKLRGLFGPEAAHLTSHLAAGRIQIRNAYPLRAGRRLLPVPAALMAEKEQPGKVVCEFYGGHENDDIQRKQLRSGYTPSDFLPKTGATDNPLVTIKTVAATHAVIEDRVQRPTADVGGVYTYEAIAPGQCFRAELRIARSVLGELPGLENLAGEVRIGRAKKDDYGRVHIAAGATNLIAPGTGNSPGEASATVTEFTLWLVSPLLLRDERLRPIVDAEALACWLNGKIDKKLTLRRAFVRSLRDDGWNNAWNEPRPTRFGLAAGSCFLFTVEGGIEKAVLASIEAEGLGERRGEGYGEVRIDAALLGRSQELPRETLGDDAASGGVAMDLAASDFTRQLHQRAWRIGIRRQALARAGDLANRLGWTQDSQPSNSQLGALRGLFEQWSDQTRLRNWLGHLRERPRRVENWPKKSLDILEKVANDDDHVWREIDVCALPILPGHSREDLRRQMAAEATRILWLTTIGAEFDRRARPPAKPEATQEEIVHGA